MTADFSQVDKVVIGNGSNGKRVTLKNTKDREEFLSRFRGTKVAKVSDSWPFTGIAYTVGLYFIKAGTKYAPLIFRADGFRFTARTGKQECTIPVNSSGTES